MASANDIFILRRNSTNTAWVKSTIPFIPNKSISTDPSGELILTDSSGGSSLELNEFTASYFIQSSSFHSKITQLSSSISQITGSSADISQLNDFTSSYYIHSSSFHSSILQISSSITNLSSSNSATASYIDYSNIANKPTLISSSAQIAPQISASFVSLSQSLDNRILQKIDSTNFNSFTSSYSQLSSSHFQLSSSFVKTYVSQSGQSVAFGEIQSSTTILPKYTEATKYTIPQKSGSLIYNESSGSLEVLDNGKWTSIGDKYTNILNPTNNKVALTMEFANNSGEVNLATFLLDANVDTNTIHGFTLSIGSTTLFKAVAKSDAIGNLSDIRVESPAFLISSGSNQETTALSLGFPARKTQWFTGNGTTTYTLPQGITIREILIEADPLSIGVDNMLVSGLQIRSTSSNKTILSAYDVMRDCYDFIAPQVSRPIDNVAGETLTISASTWNSSNIKIHIMYQNLN